MVVPRYATAIAPPEPRAGFAPVFADGAWGEVEDLRGATYWTSEGEAVVVSTLGPLPDGAVTDRRAAGRGPRARRHRPGCVVPATPPRAEAKAEVIDAIEAFEVAVVGRRSWGERESWRDQEPAAQAVLAGEVDHPGYALLDDIRARTGETRVILAERIVASATIFRRLIGPLVGYRRSIEAAIDAATDLAEIEAVTEDGLAQIGAFVAIATGADT